MDMNKTAKKLAQLTDENLHSEAVTLLAKYAAAKHNTLTGVDKLFKAAKGVGAINDLQGHVTDELNTVRRNVMDMCFNLLNEDERTLFYNSL